jgi:type II secretory pathway predicted ATPase ExeA
MPNDECRMTNSKKIFSSLIILCLAFSVLLSAVPSHAQSADDLYSRAVNKYFLGDSEGAIRLLNQALEVDPGHSKSKSLLQEIQKDLGKPSVAPPPPPTRPAPVVKPKPRPTPTVPRKLTREEKAIEKLKMLPPPAAPEVSGMQETINQIVLLLIAVMIIALIVAGRGVYFIIKDRLAELRMQVCPDCKTKNPENAEFCLFCGTRLKAWSAIIEGQRKWFTRFKWKRNPFTLDVIPSLFTGYSSQVKAVMEKINTRSGHILVYGDKGVGKTTLLRWLTDNLNRDNHAIYVARPPLDFDDMIRLVVSNLRSGFFGRRKKYSLYEVEGLIKKARKPVVILLDEAHEFTAEIEQQMRSLGDIQRINYVLAGLPVTREKIKKDSPPFFDRMVLETYIDHLNRAETREMIKKRIEDAGGEDIKPFTEEAIENIYKISKGRPRMILKVCDWIMTDAIRNNLEVIGAEAGKDFPGLKQGREEAQA